MNSERIRGKVFWPDGHFSGGEVEIRAGRIADVRSLPEEALQGDERTALILPGLVDIHSHACIGYDTCEADEEQLGKMLDFQRSVGVTSYLPTTMTYDEDKLAGVCRRIAAVRHPGLKGIYLEGPFLSREKKGAQNEAYLMKPDADMVRRLQEAAKGLIRVVAVAPETEGAMEMIGDLSGEVVLSLAHTTADYETAKRAFAAGASQVTHLFNAMLPYHHREPGLIGACFDTEGVRAELICDGIHVHEAVIRNTFRQLGPERVVMISDSMEATGMPEGTYALGGQTVYVKGRRATLADGTIAGSASTLYDCMKYAISVGVPREQVFLACTRNPAQAARIETRVGSIEPGKDADLLILEEESLKIRSVL